MSAAFVTAREALNTVLAASGHGLEDPNEIELVRRLPGGNFLALIEDRESADWHVALFLVKPDTGKGDWACRPLIEGASRDVATDFMFSYVPRTALLAVA